MSLGQLFRDLRYKTFCWLLDDVARKKNVPLRVYGDVCPYTICPDLLGPDSIVLSAGAGNDISFERDLIARHSLQVLLLDPSPTGKICVEQTALPPAHFRFLSAALTKADGTTVMRPPKNPVEGSYVVVEGEGQGEDFHSRSVESLMKENNWPRIDLLKIDIEGSEYEVIEQILARRLDIRQICVEFHYGPEFHLPRSKPLVAAVQMLLGGFDLIHRVGMDYTFIKRGALKAR